MTKIEIILLCVLLILEWGDIISTRIGLKNQEIAEGSIIKNNLFIAFIMKILTPFCMVLLVSVIALYIYFVYFFIFFNLFIIIHNIKIIRRFS